MLFNSLTFLIFFVIVYILYLRSSHKWQNILLLIASYIFYGAWDWRFLSLLMLSTWIDYHCAKEIFKSKYERRRKAFLILGIMVNLTLLCFFKYYNFFALSFQQLLNHFGIGVDVRLINVILPVGISFYTFQTMSYTLDVYRRKMKPARSIMDFALFVSFFPQLVAGPIERAIDLLPQVESKRRVSRKKIYEGCHLILWGLFLKVFVADNLAKIVNPIFENNPTYNGLVVLIGLYAFAFQILCDFSGYSTIAMGLGRCMGFTISVNFNLPYFSTNPSEFWRRWHITLSTFLRDYLYIPLGGNRRGEFIMYRNLMITMLLGGLWHGASWTFVIWGAYHGLLLVAYKLLLPVLSKVPSPAGAMGSKIWRGVRIVFFFHLICIGWLFFRAQSLSQAWRMAKGLLFDIRLSPGAGIFSYGSTLMLVLIFPVIMDILQYRGLHRIDTARAGSFVRAAFYYTCLIGIMLFGVMRQNEFIYFQF